ncbi:UDP-glucuronosyl/UDP-glucosyltransferase [Macleaya cordata]|uniref:Glycosyltransferase n=1 Tax=Macleaya cordata TaxID=56857 RepID=A0A200PP57_MACCD|nr:UDP-glucuronosyl/UDP-glucosyltransferase [Macleaya cordata]
MNNQSSFHIAMYPWFALGHLTPFLNFSNKFAERGHRISFFLPSKTQLKLEHFNYHPNLITFFPLTVPTIEGLPPGSETTSDVPVALHHLLMTAMDSTKPQLESALRELKPDFIFFDFTHWTPSLAKELGIKAIHYCIISMASVSYLLVPASNKVEQGSDIQMTEDEWMQQPPGFPKSSIRLHRHEAKAMSFITYREYGSISFHERLTLALKGADALSFRSCIEIEGAFIDFIAKHYGKQVLLSGPLLPKPPTSKLEEKWDKWLSKFEPRSVIFCAFGSECYIKKEQFQELVLGFELTGLPFFAALKPPLGASTIDEALPEGFRERVEGRGIVEGGWIQQPLIMAHPSIGCFVSHCGLSSVTETIINNPQLVLLPNAGDQFIIARLMGGDLKVGVEVERREDDGWYTKESVCKAIKTVMEEDDEIGKVVRENRWKLKDFLLREGLESDYMSNFIEKLRAMIN